MKSHPKSRSGLLLDAHSISRNQKEKHLLELTEDAFRDHVVRVIFERRGLKLLRDTCGADEEGKDSIFIGVDQLKRRLLYAIQTKRGNLNMASKAADNVVAAATQLRTALEANIYLSTTKEKVRPNHVILCASGKINNAARQHIVECIPDPRISFMDVNDIIHDIDELYPEFWYSIDAQKFPYLRKLMDDLLQSSDTIAISELGIEGKGYAPITDDSYVTLYLSRITAKTIKRRGEVIREPELEQIQVSALLKQRERRFLMTGEGGAGKTTALRRLGYELAQEGLRSGKMTELPIFMKISEIARLPQRLIEIAASVTARISPNGKAAFTVADAEQGMIVLLMDALDEIPAEDDKIAVLNKIDEFHREFPRCPIIITSRDYAFVHRIPLLQTYTRYNVISIDIKQASKIINRISKGRALPKEVATEMLRRLQDVHGMALNPLLVTVFLATSDFSKKDIPPNIAEIFKKFTELMLGRWDERKGLSQQYQVHVKDFLLGRLAFQMHRNNERVISINGCRTSMADELAKLGYEADLDVLFEEIVHRSGLLRVEDDQLEFRHHLIQEFFAGRGVPSTEFFKTVVADDWWRKPIVFYFGDKPSHHRELADLTRALDGQSPVDVYQAAITIGLAVQACYLSEITERVVLLDWVIKALADTRDDVVTFLTDKEGNPPLTAFILYYLFGRDSVACDFVTKVVEQVKSSSPEGSDLHDRRWFWRIIGLIEAGRFDLAEDAVRKFKPIDDRLLLAIHMSCFFISNLRISTNEQKKAAERICSRIEPKIIHLRDQVLKEFKGFLLEMRQGKVAALDCDSSPTTE